MILPPLPRAIIRLATACRVKNMPFALTANSLSQLASRDFDDRGQVENAGAVDENVDAAPARFDRGDRVFDRRHLRHVDFDRERFVAVQRRGLLGLRERYVGDRHFRPFGDVAIDDRRANAARAAGDEGDLILQFHGSISSSIESGRSLEAAGAPAYSRPAR